MQNNFTIECKFFGNTENLNKLAREVVAIGLAGDAILKTFNISPPSDNPSVHYLDNLNIIVSKEAFFPINQNPQSTYILKPDYDINISNYPILSMIIETMHISSVEIFDKILDYLELKDKIKYCWVIVNSPYEYYVYYDPNMINQLFTKKVYNVKLKYYIEDQKDHNSIIITKLNLFLAKYCKNRIYEKYYDNIFNIILDDHDLDAFLSDVFEVKRGTIAEKLLQLSYYCIENSGGSWNISISKYHECI